MAKENPNYHLPEFKPGDLFAKRFKILSSFLAVKMSEVYDAIDTKTNEKVRLQILNRNLKCQTGNLFKPGDLIEKNILVKNLIKRSDNYETYRVFNTEDKTESIVNIKPSGRIVFDSLELKALINDTYISMKNAWQITSQLHDERIVKIKEQGNYKNYFYIIHEYRNGRTLRKVFSEKEINSESYLSESIDIIYLIAKAIKYLHDKKIGMYSLYPESIIVQEDGGISLWGFDEAFPTVEKKDKPIRMFKKRILNTLVQPYNSKEIIENETADLTEDLHLLGSIAFELTYGHEPLIQRSGIPNERLYVIGEDYNIPLWYSKFLIRSTEPNPKLRYQTIDEVIDLFNVSLGIQADVAVVKKVQDKEDWFEQVEKNDYLTPIMAMPDVHDSIKRIIRHAREIVNVIGNSKKEKISKESKMLMFYTQKALRTLAYRDPKVVNKFHHKFQEVMHLITPLKGNPDAWAAEIVKIIVDSEGYDYN